MKILITGACGFLGSNLCADAIAKGHEVAAYENFSHKGTYENRRWLESLGYVRFVVGDVRDSNTLTRIVRDFMPEVVFHLAGQVAMTNSLENPRLDFETNALGTINLLEALRLFCPEAAIVYSSTNKVYGDLERFHYIEGPTRYSCPERPLGFDESTPFDPQSPYGCSKGAADSYMQDYARMFGLNTVVFRHSSMYGGRQFASFDQGWIGWFCQEALRIKRGKKTALQVAGDGKQVRDVLHSEDMVRLYFIAASKARDLRGEIFNIGGGMKNSLSLLELFKLIERLEEVELKLEFGKARHGDQKLFVANILKAQLLLGWTPQVDSFAGVASMLSWCHTLEE